MNKNIISELIKKEYKRQNETLGMIASENFPSKKVREATGSIFMNKYSEGYPKARYYEGNPIVDELEELCINLALKVMLNKNPELIPKWHANVQVLSGSIANLAVYNSVLTPGDTILSMYLPDGGHLSHGWSYGKDKDKVSGFYYRGGKRKVSIISKIYNVVQYKTDPNLNFQFNYEEIEKIAKEVKPKLIITGGTAYPREIDYSKMRKIADKVSAFYHADVAHEAGLIAGNACNSPFPYADFVTFTTHKTLRGPRGAVAMCKKEFSELLDKSVFPGIQGGPFNHNIAGITQAFIEADSSEFKTYALNVVGNARKLAEILLKNGFNVISGGTDKHLVLCEVQESKGLSGLHLAKALSLIGIIINKNAVPYEKGSPVNPSGIRIGTPLITTRGFGIKEIEEVGSIISELTDLVKPFGSLEIQEFIKKVENLGNFKSLKSRVSKLAKDFPLE